MNDKGHEQSEQSITALISKIIANNRRGLEKEGVSVVAEIFFGSLSLGSRTQGQETDVDYLLIADDSTRPTKILGKPIPNDGHPGYAFQSQSKINIPGIPIKEINIQVRSIDDILDNFSWFKSLCLDNRPPHSLVTITQNHKTETLDYAEFVRASSWLFIAIKEGKLMEGKIPKSIQSQLSDVLKAWGEFQNKAARS